MKDSELQFDRSCHVLYSKQCKKQIQAKIALHYPENRRESVWEEVQKKYVEFLSDWRTDLGGKKNFHNGRGGTYDCVALMAYYAVCKDVTSLDEIEEMEGNLFLTAFRKMSFIDANKPIVKKLMYRAFLNVKKQCDKWGDFKMNVAPFEENKPVLPTRRLLRCAAALCPFRRAGEREFSCARGHLSSLPPRSFCRESSLSHRLSKARIRACRGRAARCGS